eukprot:GHVT01066977.1.p1 GENE.GHVT01066977.1~~GHVT01066977.1.p1  ORF type:complete len:147 (+),score=68.38 GHVT01066977.1:167-607(+)
MFSFYVSSVSRRFSKDSCCSSSWYSFCYLMDDYLDSSCFSAASNLSSSLPSPSIAINPSTYSDWDISLQSFSLLSSSSSFSSSSSSSPSFSSFSSFSSNSLSVFSLSSSLSSSSSSSSLPEQKSKIAAAGQTGTTRPASTPLPLSC